MSPSFQLLSLIDRRMGWTLGWRLLRFNELCRANPNPNPLLFRSNGWILSYPTHPSPNHDAHSPASTSIDQPNTQGLWLDAAMASSLHEEGGRGEGGGGWRRLYCRRAARGATTTIVDRCCCCCSCCRGGRRGVGAGAAQGGHPGAQRQRHLHAVRAMHRPSSETLLLQSAHARRDGRTDRLAGLTPPSRPPARAGRTWTTRPCCGASGCGAGWRLSCTSWWTTSLTSVKGPTMWTGLRARSGRRCRKRCGPWGGRKGGCR